METRELELVSLLESATAGAEVSLERCCTVGDTLPLLAISTNADCGQQLRISAAVLLSSIAKQGIPLYAAESLLPPLATAALRIGRPGKALRHYYELAIARIVCQHQELTSVPLTLMRSGGEWLGAASLLRTVMVAASGDQAAAMGECFVLLLQAGSILISDLTGNEDRILDWLSQVAKILYHSISNSLSNPAQLRTRCTSSGIFPVISDLVQPAVSTLVRRKAYRVLSALLEIYTVHGSLLAELRTEVEAIADILLTDIFQQMPPTDESEKPLAALISILAVITTGLRSERFAARVQSLIIDRLVPYLSPSKPDNSLCDCDPHEFITRYSTVCDCTESTILLPSIGAFLRAVVEAYPWGLRFIVDNSGNMGKHALVLSAVSAALVDREDLLESIEANIRAFLPSAESLPNVPKCHFLFLLSRLLDALFQQESEDCESVVSFLIDSAGCLTCKAVSMQACSTLAELFMCAQSIVVLDTCLQEVASGLGQLIPVIRYKGLYECVRLLIVEGFEGLGSEAHELLTQLLHRVRIELQRYVFKKHHSKQANIQLLVKCFSALRAATERPLQPSTTLLIYRETAAISHLLVDGKIAELVEDWSTILAKCVEKMQKSDAFGANLMEKVRELLEIADYDYTACSVLVTALLRINGSDTAIEPSFPSLFALLEKAAENTQSIRGMDQCVLTLQSVCHYFALSNSSSGEFSRLIPWAVSRLEHWYSLSTLELWHFRLTSLYLSFAAYNLPEVLKASRQYGILLSTVIHSLLSQLPTPILPFDRKSLVFGLVHVVGSTEDLEVITASFDVILALFDDITAVTATEVEAPTKRKLSYSDDDIDNNDMENDDYCSDLWEDAQQCYSLLSDHSEKDLIRSELEEMKRSLPAKFETVISRLSQPNRKRLVSILTMESPETKSGCPRAYLVPRRSAK